MSSRQGLMQLMKFFQEAPGFIHMKTSSDRLTSAVIPLGMSAAGTALLVRGLFSMYTGTNKLE